MTIAEKQKLKALFVAMSHYYGHVIPDAALALYVGDLADLSFPEVEHALHELRRDPTRKQCPLPAVIRNHILPVPSDEQQAIEASARIVEAIAKIGPYKSVDARRFIGELGWLVVQREGGWEQACTVLTDENVGICRAQWRQMALALQTRARAGNMEPPGLPEPTRAKLGIDLKKLLPEMPK